MHFITRGFAFKHNNNNSYHVRFNDTNRWIISKFYHKNFNSIMSYHRDSGHHSESQAETEYSWSEEQSIGATIAMQAQSQKSPQYQTQF